MNAHGIPLAFDEFATEESKSRVNGKSAFDAEITQTPQWPEVLSLEAFHGIAGEFVSTVEPHCEGDSAALLVQFLVAFGNRVGRSPYYVVEATQHHMNMFACLVGMTSKARKGTSGNHVKQLFVDLEQGEAREGFVSGLSSGEGLIAAVRDAEPDVTDSKGNTKPGDPGVSDKRILVTQGEFCTVLKVMDREGNTLSGILRDAWDDGFLRVMTKKQLRATDAHISIIGHITRDELRSHLTATDKANGFANRFLWLCVKRSKLLPEGGNVPRGEMKAIEQKLVGVFNKARVIGRMRRDDAAKELWAKVYAALSEGEMGLVGSVIARAEAQVLRLQCVYALLDGSEIVKVDHLRAALAVWNYCEASCRYIFGESIGDPIADQILSALKQQPGGLSRTEIRDLFGRHKSKAQVDVALTSLLERGKVGRGSETTGGRPIEVWFAVIQGDKSDKSDKSGGAR
jgi:hypothetical protein